MLQPTLSQVDDISYHVRRYRRGELSRKLADAGFEILFSTSYTVSLLPLMAASRLSPRKHSVVLPVRPGLKQFAVEHQAELNQRGYG